MAKFYGKIGFFENTLVRPGVWSDSITEIDYAGDLIRNSKSNTNSGNVVDDITITNKISILLDPYLDKNFHTIRYCEFLGTKWKVTEASVEYPRIVLSLGGIYHD